jgi:hypothetical protein
MTHIPSGHSTIPLIQLERDKMQTLITNIMSIYSAVANSYLKATSPDTIAEDKLPLIQQIFNAWKSCYDKILIALDQYQTTLEMMRSSITVIYPSNYTMTNDQTPTEYWYPILDEQQTIGADFKTSPSVIGIQDDVTEGLGYFPQFQVIVLAYSAAYEAVIKVPYVYVLQGAAVPFGRFDLVNALWYQ